MSEVTHATLEIEAEIEAVQERVSELRWQYEVKLHGKHEDWDAELTKAKDKLRKLRRELLSIRKEML